MNSGQAYSVARPSSNSTFPSKRHMDGPAGLQLFLCSAFANALSHQELEWQLISLFLRYSLQRTSSIPLDIPRRNFNSVGRQ